MLTLLLYLTPLAGILALFWNARALSVLREEPAGDSSLQTAAEALADADRSNVAALRGRAAISAAAFFVICLVFIGLDDAFAYALGALLTVVAGERASTAARCGAARAAEAARGVGSDAATRIAAAAGSAAAVSTVAISLVAIAVLHWFFGHPSDVAVLAAFALGAAVMAASAIAPVRATGDAPGSMIATGLSAAPSAWSAAAAGFAGYSSAIVIAVVLAATSTPKELYGLASGLSEPLVLQAQLMSYPVVLAMLGLMVAVACRPLLGAAASGSRRTGALAASVFALVSLLLTAATDIAFSVWCALVVGMAGGVAVGQVRAATSDAAVGRGMPGGWLSLLALAVLVLGCHALAGAYGIAMAALGTMVTAGTTLAFLVSRGVATRAEGILVAADAGEDARRSAAQAAAACPRVHAGLASASAVVTAVAFFLAFQRSAAGAPGRGGSLRVLLDDPHVLAGALAGAAIVSAASGRLGQAPSLATAALMTAVLVIALAIGSEAAAGMLVGSLVAGAVLVLTNRAAEDVAEPAQARSPESGCAGAVMDLMVPMMSMIALVIAPLLAR
ncbi:MAG TPA: sodium/proton-translocating pyrophosphatase [Candidatus Limnocylindrales bacterium]|nr:sodium/proton-translocating pyrophosphatase [Candidatus Limnocylindrales bacterium]